MKKLIKAVKYRIEQDDEETYIQLFDEQGNPVKGEDAYWEGNFFCFAAGLTSLKGAPKEVTEGFHCNNNNLTSLKHGPEKVGGCFACFGNPLINLDHAPTEIGDRIYFEDKPLTRDYVYTKKPSGGEFKFYRRKLWCPHCGSRHIDEGALAERLHHKHYCGDCGGLWTLDEYVFGIA